MREQLNSNPRVQVAAIAILLIGGAIFLLTSMGGGGGEESSSSLSSSAPAGEGPAPSPVEGAPVPAEGAPVPAEGAGLAPGTNLATRPLPHPVLSAWKADRTVALLFVHDGGIDDRLVRQASVRLDGMAGVSTFVVPADKIADYASITEGVGVDRVPALVVLGPKRLDQSVPTASVSYGFRDGQSVEQAVIDAGYEGPTLEYHP